MSDREIYAIEFSEGSTEIFVLFLYILGIAMAAKIVVIIFAACITVMTSSLPFEPEQEQNFQPEKRIYSPQSMQNKRVDFPLPLMQYERIGYPPQPMQYGYDIYPRYPMRSGHGYPQQPMQYDRYDRGDPPQPMQNGFLGALSTAFVSTYDEQRKANDEAINSFNQAGKAGVEAGMNVARIGRDFLFLIPHFGRNVFAGPQGYQPQWRYPESY